MLIFWGALAGLLMCSGIVMAIAGICKTPVKPAGPKRSPWRWWRGLSARTRWSIGIGTAAGLIIALTTGWIVALIIMPAAAIVLPILLIDDTGTKQIDRLDAMDEWTRGLADVLTAGLGIEQAIYNTVASTPEAIKPEVSRLAARLRARWSTADALRAFADDLDDTTGDTIVATLLLGSRRRGAGLATMLKDLSDNVSSDVRARRQVEADRAKPRANARWLTLITATVLVLMFVNGNYADTYRTGLGQIIFLILMALYLATLVWMKRMTVPPPTLRFVGAAMRTKTATADIHLQEARR